MPPVGVVCSEKSSPNRGLTGCETEEGRRKREDAGRKWVRGRVLPGPVGDHSGSGPGQPSLGRSISRRRRGVRRGRGGLYIAG